MKYDLTKKLLLHIILCLFLVNVVVAFEPKVVLHYSENEINNEEENGLSLSKVTYSNFLYQIERLLVEEKIQYVLTTDQQIEADYLMDNATTAKYPLLITMGAKNISNATANKIIEFVNYGGTVLIGGQSSDKLLNDENVGVTVNGYINLNDADRDAIYNTIYSATHNLTKTDKTDYINSFLTENVDYAFQRFGDIANATNSTASSLITLTDNRSINKINYLSTKSYGQGEWVYWAEHRSLFRSYKGNLNDFVTPHIILNKVVEKAFNNSEASLLKIWRWKNDYHSSFVGLRNDLDDYYPNNWETLCNISNDLGLYIYFFGSTYEGYISEGDSPNQTILDNTYSNIINTDYCRVGMHYSNVGHHSNDKAYNEIKDFESTNDITAKGSTNIYLINNSNFVNEYKHSLNMSITIVDSLNQDNYGVSFTSDKYGFLSSPKYGTLNLDVKGSYFNPSNPFGDWNISNEKDHTMAYWSFDNDLNDLTENNNDLTKLNDSYIDCDVNGIYGKGCKIRYALGAGLTATDSNSLDTTGNITLGMFFKVDDTSSVGKDTYYFFSKKTTTSSDAGYNMYLSTDKKFYLDISNGTANSEQNMGIVPPILNNTYHCIITIFDGSSQLFYFYTLDEEGQYWYGGLYGNKTSSIDKIEPGSRNLMIGRYIYSYVEGMDNFTIDKPLILNKALSEEEILEYVSNGGDIAVKVSREANSLKSYFLFYNLSTTGYNHLSFPINQSSGSNFLVSYDLIFPLKAYNKHYNNTIKNFYVDNFHQYMFNWSEQFDIFYNYLDTIAGGYYGTNNYNTKTFVSPGFGGNDYYSIKEKMNKGLSWGGDTGLGGMPSYRFLTNDKINVNSKDKYDIVNIPATPSYTDTGTYFSSLFNQNSDIIKSSVDFLKDNKLLISIYSHANLNSSTNFLNIINNVSSNELWKTNFDTIDSFWRKRDNIIFSYDQVNLTTYSVNVINNNSQSVGGYSLIVDNNISNVKSGNLYLISIINDKFIIPELNSKEEINVNITIGNKTLPYLIGFNNSIIIKDAYYNEENNQLHYSCVGSGHTTFKNMNYLGETIYVYYNGKYVRTLTNPDVVTVNSCSYWDFYGNQDYAPYDQQVYNTGTNFKNGFAILAAFYAILAISLVGKSIVGLFRHNQPIDFKLLGKAMLIMIVSAVILLVGIAIINEFITVI